MDRRKGSIGVVLAGVIFVASLGVLLSPIGIFPPVGVSFSWEVDVGDEFMFNITASGINSTNNILAPLVNTTIQVRVISLPNDTIFSEEDFRNLVYFDKVDCTFSNGSEIPYPLKTDISNFVSRFFLPIGDWDYIDRLYPDALSEVTDDPGNEWINTHLSRYHEDAFFFGHVHNIIDDFNVGQGWRGIIALSDGVPSSMEKWGFSFNDPEFYSWIFQLEQL